LGAVTCFGLAVAYIAEAWRIIFTLRIGPVVAVIDEAHGHGIHSGDFIGIVCALLALGLLIGGAVLLDDAVGSAARLAPVTVPSRSRRRRHAPITAMATGVRTSAGRRPALAFAPSRRHRRSRRAWNAPVATA
jgi:hypothetical protein